MMDILGASLKEEPEGTAVSGQHAAWDVGAQGRFSIITEIGRNALSKQAKHEATRDFLSFSRGLGLDLAS
jgi:hypothetical protein